MITWKLPFALYIAHERIYVVDAEHKRLTEVTPGQFRGYTPSVADCKAIGGELVKLLNLAYTLHGHTQLVMQSYDLIP